ncbi:MAG: YigZ family protein [Lentisphaeria bacterium]
MLELLSPTQIEIVIRNSKFLGEVFPVLSPEEAREKLREQKSRYSDSSHVVHAFVIGLEANVLGCSDDGEPSGTAGRPVLEVLKNCGIRNIMLTVTRWFGGTKLGTGGLVRAYTECAQAVLAAAETRELVCRTPVQFTVPYALYEPVRKLLSELNFETEKEEFSEEIRIAGQLPKTLLPVLQKQLRDLSHGNIELSEPL